MEMIALALIAIGAVALAAFFGGTILYFVWPVAMVDVFHFPPLTWWQAVCLTWTCAILVKATQSNTNKS